jgi:branched-chain amino acid transport system permease protein
MMELPSAEVLIQGIMSGILMGCLYALIAAGLSLIFGLMEIVNFAHGEFLMLGMYTAFWMYTLFALDPLFSVPVCGAVLFAVGWATHKGIIKRILGAPMLAQIFATFGLGIFIRAAAQFLWSPDFRQVAKPLVQGPVKIFGISVGLPQLVASAASLLAFGFLYWFITKTETGAALEATAQDRQAAVGVAGAFLASFFYVFPYVGSLFGLIAYVTVALGGFGSIPGSLAAGIIIGVIEVLGGLLIAPAFKYVAVFLVYLIVVLIRPQGLFGKF